jgi:uncharacterized protein (TIGR03435 family)
MGRIGRNGSSAFSLRATARQPPCKQVGWMGWTAGAVFLAFLAAAGNVGAQTTAEFDAVSIKRNNGGPQADGGISSLPDGTFVMKNQPISSMIRYAAPVVVREVAGLPAWAREDRYDVIAKPAAGTTREQRSQMWRAMFAQRMKLVARVEEREIDAFALMPARSDGRLGPKLKRSRPDCNPSGSANPPARCGASFGATRIEAGSMTMDILAQWLTSLAGRLVNNRTGLQGPYELQLDFSPELKTPDTEATAGDTLPDVFTAVREQLGLKLVPEKARAPVFVIESIQRPTEN